MSALQEEIDTYERQEEDLKKFAPGKFVLIKHSEVIGTFDSLDAALAEGTRRFGLEPYMVRQIGSKIETLNVPAFTLGLISAHH